MRIALGIEYDGSAFSGWQTQQAGVRAIQPLVEAAVGAVADHPVLLHCAGRTDAGVHAAYQVVHFETSARRSQRSWVLGTNVRLPGDVGVLWAREVDEAFHARFSAYSRAYAYVISNRQTRPALWRGRVTWECRPLDADAMARAARHWLGEHDFSSFRAQGCQSKSPVRTVARCEIDAEGQWIVLNVEANAFLQHMIRNFAGVLMAIGRGERDPDWARELLLARDRKVGGVTAPPDGLYLTTVRYPASYDLPPPVWTRPMLPAFHGRAFD